jgi:hypothetical protein
VVCCENVLDIHCRRSTRENTSRYMTDITGTVTRKKERNTTKEQRRKPDSNNAAARYEFRVRWGNNNAGQKVVVSLRTPPSGGRSRSNREHARSHSCFAFFCECSSSSGSPAGLLAIDGRGGVAARARFWSGWFSLASSSCRLRVRSGVMSGVGGGGGGAIVGPDGVAGDGGGGGL